MKEEKEEYDFYGIGSKYASESIDILKRKAQEIGKKFGAQAKNEFELGIIATIPEYSRFSAVLDEKSEKLDEFSAHSIQSMPNMRNNSYFGKSGVSKQYKIMPDGSMKYNEPKLKER